MEPIKHHYKKTWFRKVLVVYATGTLIEMSKTLFGPEAIQYSAHRAAALTNAITIASNTSRSLPSGPYKLHDLNPHTI